MVGPPGGLLTARMPSNVPSRRSTPRSPVPRSRVRAAAPSSVTSIRSMPPRAAPGCAPGEHPNAYRVGERLGDREVAGRLDRRGRPAGQADVQLGRQRRVQGERLDRVPRPRSARTGGWMPRTRPRRSFSAPARSPSPRRPVPARPAGWRHHALHRPQVHAERDQPGLGAVVQIPLDPAQLGGGGVDGVAADSVSRCTRPASAGSGPGADTGRVRADRPGHQPGGERQEHACLRAGQQRHLRAVNTDHAVLHRIQERRPRIQELRAGTRERTRPDCHLAAISNP